VRDFYGLVPATPAILEAVSGETAIPKTMLVGAGALGSAFADYALRGGAKELTVVDYDTFLPHNIARHRGLREHVWRSKIDVLKTMASDRAQDVQIDDLELQIGCGDLDEFSDKIKQQSQVIDATANVLVRRYLSSITQPSIPVMRSEIFNQGKLGVTLITRLGDPQNLNYLFHYLVSLGHSNESIRNWLKYETSSSFLEEELILGHGCRSLTTKIPAYKVDAHATAAFAAGKHHLPNLSEALIAINEIGDDGIPLGSTLFQPDPVITFGKNADTAGWRIIASKSVVGKLHQQRKKAAPLETGGYLFGAIDEFLSEIYILAISGEPPGTKATETSLELGRWWQTGFEKSFIRRTQGRLPPIGTWHSHPTSSPRASTKDRKTVAAFVEEDARKGLPTIMAITGQDSDRIYVLGE